MREADNTPDRMGRCQRIEAADGHHGGPGGQSIAEAANGIGSGGRRAVMISAGPCAPALVIKSVAIKIAGRNGRPPVRSGRRRHQDSNARRGSLDSLPGWI